MQPNIKQTDEKAYFAASNSRHGFHSYYEHCFRDRVQQLYCIKGGPGTGKSTLMRAVAREGARRGYEVETYYCSSDADSLDGILLLGAGRSIGLIDATSPHTFEPRLPGVKEEIIDLGRFWNTEELRCQADEISLLNRKKAAGYRAAYRYLAAVGEVSDALRDRMQPCLDVEKMTRAVARLCRSLGAPQEGEVTIRLRDGIGMQGWVRLDSYVRDCSRLCIIEDYHDSAYVLMDMLAQRALEAGQNMQVSYHPVLLDRIDALTCTADQTTFVVCDEQETMRLTEQYPVSRVISMRRLIDREAFKEAREQLRRVGRLRETLLEEACAELDAVAKAHFRLERIYARAMNFSAKESYTAEFCQSLFKSSQGQR